MISQLNPSAQLFLNGLNRVSDRMSKAQRELTSGLRVTGVSDEPDHVGSLLSARQHLESAQQIKLNLGRVKSEVDGAETALQTATQYLEQIRTLGAQGSNDTQTADTRATLAESVGSLLEQMVGLTGTTVEGRFIFAGDQDQTVPYTIDLTQATPVSAYQGAASTRLVQHPNGSTFAVARTAQQIFDDADPTKSVFKTVEALRQALLSNDTSAIQTAVGNLAAPATQLSTQLAFYGTTQNKISEALDFDEQLQTQLTLQISTFEDADATQAILELQQGQTQQQAALSSWAQIPRSTLFDFLG